MVPYSHPATPNPFGPPPVARYRVNGGRGVRGLGALGATGTQVAGSVTGTAATVAGSNAGAIAGALGLAVPVVGIAIAGIAMAVTTWLNRMGPKQKRWTTQIADDATAQLKQIKEIYFATPYNPANQAAALQATDQMLQAIQDGCGQTQMGEPGQRCISERLVRGGSAPWCPTGTGCDYFTVYRDPIANDPRAGEWVAQQSSGSPAAGSPDSLDSSSTGPLFAGGMTAVIDSGFIPMALGGLALLMVWRGLGD
jgi:hypothetical protein